MTCNGGPPAGGYELPAAWGAFPPCPMRRFQNGTVYTSMRDWFDHGPEMVAAGATGVHIKDRAPCVLDDGSHAWRSGGPWRARSTLTNRVVVYLPAPVFARLPGGVNRWADPVDPFDALDRAAWNWAVGGARRG